MYMTVDIIRDEGLMECLDRMISAMLPHENFEEQLFPSVLQGVFGYLPLEEMQMEYYIMFNILQQLRQTQSMVKGFRPTLTKEIMTMSVEPSMFELVKRPEVKMRDYLISEGLGDDLSIETTMEVASQRLYERLVDLYDRSFELKLSGSEAISLLPSLRANFVASVSASSMATQRRILEGSVRIGRDVFAGAEGWMEYSRKLNTTLSARVNAASQSVLVLDSPDKGVKLLEEASKANELLAEYGIPPLDMTKKMVRNWLLIIAGNEGVGKTTICVFLAALLIKSGRKVCYMVGESNEGQLFNRIVSAYIYVTRNLYITSDHVNGIAETTEEMQRIIKLVAVELSSHGRLIFRKAFSYYGFYNEASAVCEENGSDVFIIDHSKALTGGRKEREDLDALAYQARELKLNYPVMVVITSHLSTFAKEALNRGREITNSPTRGSSSLSGEADQVLVLNSPPDLKARGIVAIDVYKNRGPQFPDLIMVKLKSSYSIVTYDPRDQLNMKRDDVTAQSMIEATRALYDNGGDDFGLIEDEYEDD